MVKLLDFRVPSTRGPKLMSDGGTSLYLLNMEWTNTLMGMVAMISPPSQMLGSITYIEGDILDRGDWLQPIPSPVTPRYLTACQAGLTGILALLMSLHVLKPDAKNESYAIRSSNL